MSCRVAEIQCSSSPSDWSHCPTLFNVADDLTKGITASEVNGRWFNGPKFLQLPEDLWPLKQGTPDMTEVNRERRKVQIACAAVVCQLVMDCREFPTWRRLLRVTAYGIRFCRNLHFKLSQQSDTNQVQVGPLRARRRSHHYEIPAGFEKVFLIPWLSQGSTIRQRFTNDRS